MLPSDRSHAPCFCAFEKMDDHWSVKKQTYVLGRGCGAVEEIEHIHVFDIHVEQTYACYHQGIPEVAVDSVDSTTE